MGLNKQQGNMYPFVTHTWNPIRGKCPHDCIYCYMKVYPQLPLTFATKELSANLGIGNFIFVGSSTDMWCQDSWDSWILWVLRKCKHHANRYLFQSKNPYRFSSFISELPSDSILGTTIESNKTIATEASKAPSVWTRFQGMRNIVGIPKMVSIEPIMDFDFDTLADWIKQISPEFVSIGADSKGHNLHEPSAQKTKLLIEALQKITKVKVKSNLSRILNTE